KHSAGRPPFRSSSAQAGERRARPGRRRPGYGWQLSFLSSATPVARTVQAGIADLRRIGTRVDGVTVSVDGLCAVRARIDSVFDGGAVSSETGHDGILSNVSFVV